MVDTHVISLQKKKEVFTASSPVCCFQAKIETKNGSRNVKRFVCANQHSEERCSNSNERSFHIHIAMIGQNDYDV